MSNRIFVLDDDELACELVKNVLTKEGYEVMSRTQAIGATTTIKSFKPDLILLDVMMPAISGENFVEIIQKSIHPVPKVLFYSNLSAPELEKLVEETGVEGYVCKVDGPQALIKNVAGFLSSA